MATETVGIPSGVRIGAPIVSGGLNKPYGRSTTALRDARDNPPNVAVLSFPLPLALAVASQERSLQFTAVNIYLRVEASPADPQAGVAATYTYSHLESQGIHGVLDHLEYHYFLITAVHGETYAVNWTLPDGTVTPKTPVAAQVYFPALADPERRHTQVGQVTIEHIRRIFLVCRQMGERVILFKRKISGTTCECYSMKRGDGLRDCPKCYGTSFVGGYDVYPRILMRPLVQQTKLQAGEFGILMDATPRAWMPIVPEITDRDMVLRQFPDGRYWAYEMHNLTRKIDGPSAIPVIQEFSLKLLEPHEPVYRVISELVPTALLPVESRVEPGVPNRWS